MSDRALDLPELGPSLGRLVAPPAGTAGGAPSWIPLEDLRLGLVTRLFELAGEARRYARAGDRGRTLGTLNGAAWARTWHEAVSAVAARAATTLSERLQGAAAEARLPRRRAARLALDQEETRALAARLAHGAAEFHQALEELDAAIEAEGREDAAPAAAGRWREAQSTAARRLESAWLALESALAEEWQNWELEVTEIRAWRRPLWPLVTASLVLFTVAVGAGLLLGGYLPAPAPLRPLLETVWARWN